MVELTKIPRVFHFIWFGPEEENYIESWRERHDSWVFNLWSEADLFPLGNQDLFDRAAEIAPGSEGQFKSDLARYEILWRYGGVYVDCDMECLHPIDELLNGHDCFAAWERRGVWVNNAIMGAAPYNPVIGQLVEGLMLSVVNRADGARPNSFSGPQYLTPIWKASGAPIFPQQWFYPYSFRELERDGETFPDSYAVHHWANTRRRLDRPRHQRA